MKSLTVLLAGALIVGPAPALTLADDENAQCAAEGGCIVITATRLESELAAFRAKTLRECKGAS
jgi:hypothetical protein